jgi:hypothetical protein
MMAACLGGARAENLVSNGDFSESVSGATATCSGPDISHNITAFRGWRLFTLDALDGKSLTGTIVDTPSGGRAIRLDFTSPDGMLPTNFGLDRESFPVTPGQEYEVSFEAAHVSGSTRLDVIIPEYNADREFLGAQTTEAFPVTEAKFQKFAFLWTPKRAETTEIGLQFAPQMEVGDTNISLLIGNVQIKPTAQPK